MRGVWLALVLTAVPYAARAQERATPLTEPAKTREGEANRLAREGKLHFDANEYDAALALFNQAAQLAKSPVFDLYIARCEKALGHYRRALLAYHRVSDATVDRDNPPWVRAQHDALIELDALQRETPRVTVTLSSKPPSATISALLDDELCPWPIQGLALDPGAHRLLLRAGTTSMPLTFRAQPSETTELRLEWPLPTSKYPDPKRPTSAPPRSREARPTTRAQPASLAPWMWTSFALGAVASAVGTATGVVVLNRTAALRTWCKEAGHVCRDGEPEDDHQRKLQSDGRRIATVSDIAFVVAGVATVSGVLLFAFDRPARPRDARLKLEATVGSLTLKGQF